MGGSKRKKGGVAAPGPCARATGQQVPVCFVCWGAVAPGWDAWMRLPTMLNRRCMMLSSNQKRQATLLGSGVGYLDGRLEFGLRCNVLYVGYRDSGMRSPKGKTARGLLREPGGETGQRSPF